MDYQDLNYLLMILVQLVAPIDHLQLYQVVADVVVVEVELDETIQV
jgi:hypothetical protein